MASSLFRMLSVLPFAFVAQTPNSKQKQFTILLLGAWLHHCTGHHFNCPGPGMVKLGQLFELSRCGHGAAYRTVCELWIPSVADLRLSHAQIAKPRVVYSYTEGLRVHFHRCTLVSGWDWREEEHHWLKKMQTWWLSAAHQTVLHQIFFFFFLMWFLCTRFWEIADTVMFREVVVVVWRTLHLVLVMYVLKAFQCVCVFEWVIKWVCVFEWLNECVCGKLQVGKNLYTLLHFIIVSWLVFLFIRCFLYIFASKWKRIWSLLFVFVFFWGVFFSFFLSFFEKGDFFSLCLSSFVYSIIS